MNPENPAQAIPYARLAKTSLAPGLVINDVTRWEYFNHIEERIIAHLHGQDRVPLGGYLDFEEPIVSDRISNHPLPTRGFTGKVDGHVELRPFDLQWFVQKAPNPEWVSEDMIGLSAVYRGEVFSNQKRLGELLCQAAYIRPYPLNTPRPKHSSHICRVFEIAQKTVELRQKVEGMKAASTTRAIQVEGWNVRNPFSGGSPGLGRKS